MFKLEYIKDKILWLVFSLFILITLFGLINHAPWRDEAQSWLLARDLNLSELIAQMPYEGTPPLWHLILWPFAQTGFPYETELIIHYLIALALIFIFLFSSPLPKLIKALIPFSYYFLFEYSIVARNYSLTALILFILAATYQQRLKSPLLYASLIFLLAWTNVHSLILAGILFLLFTREIIKKELTENKYLLAISLSCIGLISAILFILPQIDQYTKLLFNGWFVIPQSLFLALLPFSQISYLSPYLIAILSLLWIPVLLIIKNKKLLLIFGGACLWLFFIFIYKHVGDLRHYGLIFVIFLFIWWLDLSQEKNNKKNLSLKYYISLATIIFLLIINTSCAGYFYIHNYQKNFSGAKEMASYIKDNNLDIQEIAAYPSYSGSALLPYLPGIEFYQMETGRKGTFLTWDLKFSLGNITPYATLKNNLIKYYQAQPNKPDRILLLTTFSGEADPDLTFITKNTKQTVKEDEFFYLYWLNLK